LTLRGEFERLTGCVINVQSTSFAILNFIYRRKNALRIEAGSASLVFGKALHEVLAHLYGTSLRARSHQGRTWTSPKFGMLH
jgi:hypothetical protein